MSNWKNTLEKALSLFMETGRKRENDFSRPYSLLHKALMEWKEDEANLDIFCKVFGEESDKPVCYNFEFVQDENLVVAMALIATQGDKLYWQLLPGDNLEERVEEVRCNSCGLEDQLLYHDCYRVLSSNKWIHRMYVVKSRYSEDGICSYTYGSDWMDREMNKELGVEE